MSVDVTPARGVPAGALLDFDEVVRATSRIVRAVAFRVLHDAFDVDDAVQEAFVRAHASIATLRDVRALPAWIARIAHHAAVDVLRARLRSRRIDDDARLLDAHTAHSARSAEDVVAAGERNERLHKALDALPDDMKRVVELRVRGLSAPEIARALGVPLGTVDSRLHRAKTRIMSECFDGPTRPQRRTPNE